MWSHEPQWILALIFNQRVKLHHHSREVLNDVLLSETCSWLIPNWLTMLTERFLNKGCAGKVSYHMDSRITK